ncbi:MAG: sigma-70 family RNA polymerase sigma factor [Candidatus Sericytochromatia bacterium]|nr:sigma-70 family RNA polymerase sigma factor [Candidatus Sericytochromatia bacterium]
MGHYSIASDARVVRQCYNDAFFGAFDGTAGLVRSSLKEEAFGMMDATAHRHLLQAARGGDRLAFEQLVSPHLARLYRLAHHLVGNPDDAADILQDSMVKAFRAFADYREEAELGTWLGRIVRNTMLDDVKRAYRRHEEATEQLPERPVHLTEPGAERAELQQLLQGFIAELSDKLREPLVLYDLEGYSYEEIAAILDVQLGTVKSRLNRARLALKDRILAAPEVFDGYLDLQTTAISEGLGGMPR